MSRLRADCHVLVDFDGTIATTDTTDALLEQFALPEWQDIEDEWKAGRIGSRECMVRQIDLVRATPEALDAFIAGIEIDSHVPTFFAAARGRGVEITVVSDGLDRTVNAVLRRHGIVASVRANKLDHAGGDRWRLSFPHAKDDCRALSGNCKCATPTRDGGKIRIVVGDGRSDFCVSEDADFVLAKSKLIHHARAKSLPHAAFVSFEEATALFSAWLDAGATDIETSIAALAAETEAQRT